MAALISDIDAIKLAKNMTVKIKVKRLKELRFRVWLAGFFFMAGARIIGCNIEITEELKDDALR